MSPRDAFVQFAAFRCSLARMVQRVMQHMMRMQNKCILAAHNQTFSTTVVCKKFQKIFIQLTIFLIFQFLEHHDVYQDLV